jgi:tRNA-specific adenosine deaminase 1
VHQATEVADAFAAAPEFTVSPNGAVRGRKGYETYGAIRTKPGRADSPPSISFSCSDKIATWNVLGLQGGLLSALFGPVYLDHIVVGGVETPALEENSSEWEDKVAAEAQRALYGRLEHVKRKCHTTASQTPPPTLS